MSLVYYHDMSTYVDEVKKFADSVGLREQLDSKLKYLEEYGDGTSRCRLFKDFAKHSFSFIVDKLDKDGHWVVWFSGALIYHGPQAGETFAVNVNDTVGWSIHT